MGTHRVPISEGFRPAKKNNHEVEPKKAAANFGLDQINFGLNHDMCTRAYKKIATYNAPP